MTPLTNNIDVDRGCCSAEDDDCLHYVIMFLESTLAYFHITAQ